MADGDENGDGVGARGRGGWVDARGHVDVEGGLGGDLLVLEDAVEAGAVLVGQEDVVCFQLGDGA